MLELAAIDWSRLWFPPVPAIVFGTLAGVTNLAVIGYFWLRSRETRLKERMVEKGYSADEIERVVRAGPHASRPPYGPRLTQCTDGPT